MGGTGNHQTPKTLRQQVFGKNQNKGIAGGGNVKSILKVQHLQKLASWATVEVDIPSLGAFFGQRFAASGESLGIPLDPSLFTCERCESILQPGSSNCTTRIERSRSKTKRRNKKSIIPSKNNVVYTCHFCSHRNVKRGTSKHQMKDILPPKPIPVRQPKRVCSDKKNSSSAKTLSSTSKMDVELEADAPEINPAAVGDVHTEENPGTPVEKVWINLSENRRKRSRARCKKQVGIDSNCGKIEEAKTVGGSTKRKRKSWTSLKELAEKSESKKIDIGDLTIPFFL